MTNEAVEPERDALEALEERMANPPKLWAPKGAPNDKEVEDCLVTPSVKGIIEEIEVRAGDYGDYRVATLVQRDRSRVQVFGFGTVLAGRFASLKVGDALGVTYLGTRPSSTPGMRDYDDYDVVVLRNGRPEAPELAEEAPSGDWGASESTSESTSEPAADSDGTLPMGPGGA